MTRKMKFKRRLASALFALAVPLAQGAWAASLHAIIVADEDDKGIGAYTDVPKIERLTDSARRATCLKGKDIVIKAGPGVRKKVEDTLNGLSVGADDVVLFYYSGHGANPGEGDRWPTLAVERTASNLLKLSSVRDTLQKKNPRLLITIADACNVFMDGGGSRGSRQADQPAGFKKLFMGYKGTIIASSSVPGQYSFGDPQNGGFFTKQFVERLNEAQASTNPDWKTIMDGTTKAIIVNHTKQKNQQPQAKVDVTPVGGSRAVNTTNEWECPGKVEDASVKPDGETNPDTINEAPLSSNLPKCSEGKMERKDNQDCCLDDNGRERCFND
jgi:hypothetical protein